MNIKSAIQQISKSVVFFCPDHKKWLEGQLREIHAESGSCIVDVQIPGGCDGITSDYEVSLQHLHEGTLQEMIDNGIFPDIATVDAGVDQPSDLSDTLPEEIMDDFEFEANGVSEENRYSEDNGYSMNRAHREHGLSEMVLNELFLD